MNRILCLCVASLVILSSCRSRKKKSGIVTVKQDTSAAFRMQSDQQRLEKYAFQFQYLSLEGTIDLDKGNNSQKASLNIRMLKDSLIWIRISKAGLEAARILINRDSLFVLDRINTEYYVYPVSYLEKTFNIKMSFDDVQRLLVGNLVFNSRQYSRSDSAGTTTWIAWEDEYYRSQTSFTSKLYRPENTDIKDKKSNKKSHITYTDFNELNGQNLARKIMMDIMFGKEPSKVEIVYSSANTNPIAEFPFYIPSTYERKH